MASLFVVVCSLSLVLFVVAARWSVVVLVGVVVVCWCVAGVLFAVGVVAVVVLVLCWCVVCG